MCNGCPLFSGGGAAVFKSSDVFGASICGDGGGGATVVDRDGGSAVVSLRVESGVASGGGGLLVPSGGVGASSIFRGDILFLDREI